MKVDNKNAILLKFDLINNRKRYKIEEIWNSKIYAKYLKANYLLELHYLVFQKD